MKKLIMLLFMAVCLQGLTVAAGSPRLLYWVPNYAGLFSQFLQTKVMYHKASQLGRNLVIVHTSSPHYGNRTIDMCEIFNLPENVSCSKLQNGLACANTMKVLERSNSTEEVCYTGTIAFDKHSRVRSCILRAVHLPMRFQFSSTYSAFATRFQEEFERLASTRDESCCSATHSHYTVVHWRRGDQLGSRCAKSVDASVNCGNASALVRQVREHSPYAIVYVATNEPQHSLEMKYLRTQGFVSYADVVKGSEALSEAESGDVFKTLAAEASLMLAAGTFLGWGVSEINDVVERERQAARQSSCLAQPAPQEENQHTWCSLYGHHAPDPHTHTRHLTPSRNNEKLAE